MRFATPLSPLLALAILAGPALAHGGTFTGYKTGQAPSHPYGAGQPPPTIPAGSPVARPPGLTGTGAFTPLAALFQIDLTEWSWWWELNKEPFLRLRARLLDTGAVSGSDGFFLGRGAQEQRSDDGVSPTPDMIRDEIVPALLRAMEDERSQDILTACLIALARIGEDRLGAETELEPVLREYLGHMDRTVAETAVVALGILGRETSVFLLSDILRDTKAGRAAVKETEVSYRLRAFAAYALALIGAQSEREDVRRFVVHVLTRGIEEDDTPSADLSAACVIALGRVPLESCGEFVEAKRGVVTPSTGSREAQVAFLLELLRDDRKLKRLARAHVPTSLALLASGPALDGSEVKTRVAEALLGRLVASRHEDPGVLASCVVGLGLIGDPDADELDVRIRRALIGISSHTSDRQSRRYALVSAGQVAERDGRGEPVGVAELRSHLLRRLAGAKGDMKYWAGLGLAMVGRGEAARGEIPSDSITRALRHELKTARTPLEVGAFSIACGLLRDVESSELLRDKLQRTREDKARGHAAIGLGLLNDRDSLVPIQRLADDSTYRPDLLRELAIALGLLGDRTAVDLLLDKLERARALSAQASIARALGRIGDRRAVTPLVAMLETERLSDQARAFAAVALGIVADTDEMPWNTVLAVGLDYTSAPVTLFDLQGFGVLNIL